ncbi:MAG: DUF1499 domain-containing protein [Planctomycetes bacterium]|nr:DUF1499 domain-containing protein [Planctomycetota bacterium]
MPRRWWWSVLATGLLVRGVGGVACVGCAGTRPTELGWSAGKLADCPSSPNCVVSQADATDSAFVEPLRFEGEPAFAWSAAVAAARALSGASVVEQRDDYLWIECKSRMFGFVDDLEFALVVAERRIEVRSASRLGYSDLGVNRARIETLRERFANELATRR